MLCFRVIFWGAVFIVWMIPALFFFSIVGRIAGFRPGARADSTEKAFGWVGIAVLGSIMLAICGGAGFIDWTVASFAERAQNGQLANFQMQPQLQPQPMQANPFQPLPFNEPMPIVQATPKPIPAEWNDEKMQPTFLSNMAEMNARVGWGAFGKKGKLGYHVFNNDLIKVDGKHYEEAISMHPPSLGYSSVQYRLQRAYKLFRADAAMGDVEHPNFQAASPARYHVLGDGQLLWVSDPLQQHGAKRRCRISVEGVETLELQIHCPGHNGHVRGVWLDPYVLK